MEADPSLSPSLFTHHCWFTPGFLEDCRLTGRLSVQSHLPWDVCDCLPRQSPRGPCHLEFYHQCCGRSPVLFVKQPEASSFMSEIEPCSQSRGHGNGCFLLALPWVLGPPATCWPHPCCLCPDLQCPVLRPLRLPHLPSLLPLLEALRKFLVINYKFYIYILSSL